MLTTAFLIALLCGLLGVKSEDVNCNKVKQNFKRECLSLAYQPLILTGCEVGTDRIWTRRRKKCEGQEQKLVSYCAYSCIPTDGAWGSYTAWSKCTAECAGGTQYRTRECNNPAPANGGADCVGSNREVRQCNTDPCAVDGGWGNYGAWSACSASCGGGSQTRSRKCNDPAPSNGGANCVGPAQQSRDCNTSPCPVDGGYSDFGAWSACSADCDGGTQSRTRQCNNPAPANGGADCVGPAVQTQQCNTDPCKAPECPASHPFVYNNGKNCCAVNFEDWDWTRGDKCDGSALQRDSLCCQFNRQIACPSGICDSNSQGTKCPSSHPYVYYNGQYCCNVDYEKFYPPQGDKCDGSTISRTSLCCGGGGMLCPTGPLCS